ncbi:MAG: TonB-dependent receptor [Thiomicrospira sp.]|nr:TonB-dependent receptor [Thiomicrospira sp.]
MAENQLSEIVVTASNTEQTQRTVTANMHVITREEIEARQYKTVAEALRAVPSISSYSNGTMGSSTTLYMRGLDGKNILVLIDGVTINEPMGLSGANFNHLLIDNVERIEVVKGAQSGIWGADAVAGVINIITRKTEKRTILNANLETGSNQYRKLSSQIGDGNEKFDFLLGFANVKTDGFSSVKPYRKSEYDFEKDGFQQTDLSLKLGINLTPTQRIETNLQKSDATVDYDGTTDPDADFYNNFTSTLRQINYQGNFNQLRLKLYAQDNQIQRESFDNFPFKAESSVVDMGALARYQYGLHQVQISVNEKKIENKLNGQGYTNTGLGITNTNLFNNQNLIITQALRADKYNAFEDKLTGKLGIKNWFNDHTFVATNFGTAYRAPTINEVANSTIKPESSEVFDLTVGYSGFELTYFYQTTKNKINYAGGWPNAIYENISGESTFKGLEAVYTNSFDAIETDFSLGYGYLSAKNDEGESFARRPEQQASLSLDYYGLTKTHLGLETRYIGKTYDKADQQGAQIGEYFVTDLTADYELTKHISLYGKVQNLFDENYIPAVSAYEADGVTPSYVYGNGGTQFFVGIRGKL